MADLPKNTDEKQMRGAAAKAGASVEKTGEKAPEGSMHSVSDLLETGPEAQQKLVDQNKP